jgi:hypothetical protein
MDDLIREVLRDKVVAQVRSASNRWTLTGEGTVLADPVEVEGRRFQVVLTNRNTAYVFDTDHPSQQARCTPYQSAAMRGLTS